MFFRRRTNDFKRIADWFYDVVPATDPRVVDTGDRLQLRLMVWPNYFVVVEILDRTWVASLVMLDPRTGAPYVDPVMMRIMFDSIRPLAGSLRDLDQVVMSTMGCLVECWEGSRRRGDDTAEWSARALAWLDARMARGPAKPV